MKKIDAGIEYSVYDISEDFVLKIPNSLWRIILTNILWHRWLLLSPIKFIRMSINTYKLREKSLSYIVNQKIPRSIFWNFEITKRWIIQERVQIFGEYVQQNPKNIRKYIREYTKLLRCLWEYKCSDIHFNITINTWINKHEDFVIIDLWELCFDKVDVLNLIREKSWLKNYSFLHDMEPEVQLIFREEMSTIMTVENVEKHWWKKL